jgi:hypothetical protein
MDGVLGSFYMARDIGNGRWSYFILADVLLGEGEESVRSGLEAEICDILGSFGGVRGSNGNISNKSMGALGVRIGKFLDDSGNMRSGTLWVRDENIGVLDLFKEDGGLSINCVNLGISKMNFFNYVGGSLGLLMREYLSKFFRG